MFGFVFHESLIQYPKVLTSSEIARKLRISYKAASLLKRRFQLLCSDLLPIYKDLTFKVLETQFKEFKLDPNSDVSLVRKMAQKPYVCADSAVLYSASQRANKGRARYRKTGLTASIYLSEKLGGKQVGTLFHSIAIKNGPAFFTSIPDTKADTIGPLLVKQLPFSTPLFTDEGYPWLFGVYKNHRSVNHSAKSKDNRYRLAKNRWCRDGVHNQVAEGNHRLVKTAFSAYGYIRPEFSQLYLDEFSFLKNANVIGLEALGSSETGENIRNSDGVHYSTMVRNGRKGYARQNGDNVTKNWLKNKLSQKKFHTKENTNDLRNHSQKSILNSESVIKKSTKGLAKELRNYNAFWQNKNVSHQAKQREFNNQKLAFKIWHHIQSNESKAYDTVEEICLNLKVHKKSVLKILRKWIQYRFILRRRIYNLQNYDFKVNFQIVPNRKDLPYLLYSKLRGQKHKIQFTKKGKINRVR
ncbi:hypothetical protein LIBAT_17385 [Leptospira interrogans]